MKPPLAEPKPLPTKIFAKPPMRLHQDLQLGKIISHQRAQFSGLERHSLRG
jgi:hypothetical protein